MSKRGWRRESARHSLAARMVKTRTPKHEVTATVNGKNPLKEKPKVEELEAACAQALEEKAVAESDSEEGANELLSDARWLKTSLTEVLKDFKLDNGIETIVAAKLQRKYSADGVE